jgi:hypothetical protein
MGYMGVGVDKEDMSIGVLQGPASDLSHNAEVTLQYRSMEVGLCTTF